MEDEWVDDRLVIRRDDAAAAHIGEEQVDLLPARGIALSVAIGAGLWALILAVGWLIFR